MKHLLKKINLRGGGSKKPKVSPASLRPPSVGAFQFSSSFSFVETLDLVSDGPIEGFVNNNGSLLNERTISQGIYLDGTPISVTNDNLISSDIRINESSFSGSDFDVSSVSDEIKDFIDKNNSLKILKVGAYAVRNYSYGFLDRVDPYTYYRFGGNSVTSNSVNLENVKTFDGLIPLHLKNPSNDNYFLTLGPSAYAAKSHYENIDASENPYQRFEEIKTTYTLAVNDGNEYMAQMIRKSMTRVFGGEWENLSAEQLHFSFFSKENSIGIVYDPRGIEYFADVSAIDNSGNLKNIIINPATSSGSRVTIAGNVKNLLIPEVLSNGDLSGKIIGLYFASEDSNSEFLDQKYFTSSSKIKYYDINFSRGFITSLSRVDTFSVAEIANPLEGEQYNYTNVLLEKRFGEEDQVPFRYFNKVFIDKNIQKELYGPYRLDGEVQRINQPEKKDDLDPSQESLYFLNNNDRNKDGLPDEEGSNDSNRGGESYSKWNSDNAQNIGNEIAAPITHIIYNPNVSQAFVTLAVNSLFDSVEESKGELKAGDKIPAVLNIQIETGKIESNGKESNIKKFNYRISAVVDNQTLIDIGNPDSADLDEYYRYVKDLDQENRSLSVPFDLPKIQYGLDIKSDEIPEKRFIRVKKLSTETFSILLKKDVTLVKVTEIIDSNFSYPFSAIIGTKLDSRQFNSIPERTFDLRLKKIKVPSNYFPTNDLNNKKDKRYYNRVIDFENTDREDKLIYKGDWDGTLVEKWTDNPAWILYDLLTNTRYGLGQQVSESEVNKWELYKIGRFCDAVDDQGYFVGVPDSQGGLEPRFSCNILFNNNEKIFDAIQTISSLFRGKTFFRSSEVSFSDDRIKDPISLFNNINVKDGLFNYANLRRDQQYNTVEVGYLDRFENFAPKIEVVEDAEDIRSRGVFKTNIDALGVTSKAMARRIGQHLIYKTVKENQKVAFNAGFEALLCQPGDLIIIEDELKSNKSNFGKVLAVDEDDEYIRLSGPYDSDSMEALLTVYVPTGDQTIDESSETANLLRNRSYTNFTTTKGSGISGFLSFTGEYGFHEYSSGYSKEVAEENGVYEQYSIYTGVNAEHSIYFKPSTGPSLGSWRFASGILDKEGGFANDDGFYYFKGTDGIHDLEELNLEGSLFDTKDPQNEFDLTSSGIFSNLNLTNGILESEISLGSNPQIITLSVTGSIGDVVGYRGCFVSGVDLPEYLPHIKAGSPYRLDLKDSSDYIYKVESIQEESINDYLVTASKFDTGKYNLIENDISIEPKENTFAYKVGSQVGDVFYEALSSPENISLTTGVGSEVDTFFIQADWDNVTNNNGYNVILNLPNGRSQETSSDQDVNTVTFDNINTVGNFNVNVKAIGDLSSTTKYFDSSYSTFTEFFLYEDLTSFDKPFISTIKFR